MGELTRGSPVHHSVAFLDARSFRLTSRFRSRQVLFYDGRQPGLPQLGGTPVRFARVIQGIFVMARSAIGYSKTVRGFRGLIILGRQSLLVLLDRFLGSTLGQ